MDCALTFREITTLDDPLYDDYLDLYQKAFPLDEQVLVSDFNRALRARTQGGPANDMILAALDGAGVLVGLARYALLREAGAGFLWYLAVQERLRGHGAGASLYREVVSRVKRSMPDALAITFEVERADVVPTPERADFARRRIRFYQRNGAFLLGGIHYVQSVGWQPEVEMHLMFHPFQPLDAGQAYRLAAAVYGDAVQQTGELVLVPAA